MPYFNSILIFFIYFINLNIYFFINFFFFFRLIFFIFFQFIKMFFFLYLNNLYVVYMYTLNIFFLYLLLFNMHDSYIVCRKDIFCGERPNLNWATRRWCRKFLNEKFCRLPYTHTHIRHYIQSTSNMWS